MTSRSYQSCVSATSATTVMNNTKRPLYTQHIASTESWNKWSSLIIIKLEAQHKNDEIKRTEQN